LSADPDTGFAFLDGVDERHRFAPLKNLLNGAELKPRQTLEFELDIMIPVPEYAKMFRKIRDLIKKEVLSHNLEVENIPRKLSNFMSRIKKGSRNYRTVLLKDSNRKLGNKNVLSKFFSLCGLDIMVPVKLTSIDNRLLKFNSWWNYSFISNRLREFIFKFSNNLLGIKCRIAHFNHHVNELCTFCELYEIRPSPRETFSHLFFDCKIIDDLLVGFEGRYLTSLNLNNEVKRRHFWFCAFLGESFNETKIFYQLTVATIHFYIWECKLKKNKVSLSSCLNFYFYHMELARKLSNKLKNEMSNIDLDLCRHWQGERQRGW
jgi:hypothetical protein